MSITTDLSTAIGQVRHYTGDVNDKDVLLTDVEVQFELTSVGSDVISAADKCFLRILSRLAREIDRSPGRFSASRSQKFQQYTDLHKQFRSEFLADADSVKWNEHSLSDTNSIESDSDFIQPAFGVGMDDIDR